jgi:hypothetical protein
MKNHGEGEDCFLPVVGLRQHGVAEFEELFDDLRIFETVKDGDKCNVGDEVL